MAVKKQYLKSKPVCKVTFSLPRDAAHDAKKANVVGEFNAWSQKATPMKRLKNGNFTATVDLDIGREYQFRYLLDGKVWENDGAADRYVPNPYGDGDNSVVII